MIENNQRKDGHEIAHRASSAFTPEFAGFYVPLGSGFSVFLSESVDFACSSPELIALVETDMAAHSLAKKKVREADRLHRLRHPEIFDGAGHLDGFADLGESFEPRQRFRGEALPRKVERLEAGRPCSLTPTAVLVLLLIKHYLGSCTSQEAVDWLIESQSLKNWLDQQNLTLPARSTLHELLGAVSHETHAAIFAKQLQGVFEEGLDSFERGQVDSTAIKANSAFPTDPKIFFLLVQRVFNLGTRFDRIGLQNIRPGRLDNYLETLSKLPFRINMSSKKERELNGHYRTLIDIGSRFVSHGLKEAERLQAIWEEQLASPTLLPSQREHAQERVDLFLKSLAQAATALKQTDERVFEGKKLASRERLLSVNDRSAAFIKKGGRDVVIGYKPQLARSTNGGFVTAILVEEGNTNDAVRLLPTVEAVIANTGVVPCFISADDGYSSLEGVDGVKSLGVSGVSISGAKGKALLGEELWAQDEYRQERADRSAIESLMFCLKFDFEFGRCRTTGIEAVKIELLGKCVAYNLCRSILLRERKRKARDKAA